MNFQRISLSVLSLVIFAGSTILDEGLNAKTDKQLNIASEKSKLNTNDGVDGQSSKREKVLEPGVILESGKSSQGKVYHRKIFDFGVIENIDEGGDGSRYFVTDTNDKGAAFCALEIWSELEVFLDTCSVLKLEKVQPDVDWAVGKLEEFLISNSKNPTIRRKLNEAATRRKRWAIERKQKVAGEMGFPTEADERRWCRSETDFWVISRLYSEPENGYKEKISKMLSAPQPLQSQLYNLWPFTWCKGNLTLRHFTN